jgi:hypothetical protein
MQAFYRGAWCKASAGLYVQASPVRRCVLGLLSTHRDMVADLHSGCIVYLNRDAGRHFIGGRGARPCRPVRAGFSCAAVRSGPNVLSTHRDMVAD